MPEVTVTEETLVLLLVVASLVAIGVSFLRVPYTIALVVVGLFLGLGQSFQTVDLTRELILFVFLPPLLFEGALNMDLEDLRERWFQVGILASVGTVIVVALMTLGFSLGLGMDWTMALVLATILAPTDPVSVLAMFREQGVGGGLRTILEGESIFNDALAIVIFLIAVEVAFPGSGTSVGATDALYEFGSEVILGLGAGLLVGFVAHRLMSAVDNHLVEITLSIVTAFGSYLLADQFGGSGVIATVSGGLLIGNYGVHFAMSASSRVSLIDFWEVMAFVVNSLLFLLIGLKIRIAEFTDPHTLWATLLGILLMLGSRAVVTYGMMGAIGRFGGDIPSGWLTAMFWGGLRGAIPVALVLGLRHPDLEGTDAVTVVFGVVLFSLVVQGLTYRPLLNRLGLTRGNPDLEEFERLTAEALVLRASLRELEDLRHRGEITTPLYARMKAQFTEELDDIEERLSRTSLDTTSIHNRQVQLTARRLAAAQRSALADARRRGILSDRTIHAYSERIEEALEQGRSAPYDASQLEPGLYPPREDSD